MDNKITIELARKKKDSLQLKCKSKCCVKQ